MIWFWTLQWLLVFITNSADSGPYSDYRYMLPLTITCDSADSGLLNDCMLPLIIYWGWFWTQQWLLVAITNSTDSWQYITIMNDYSVPLNTMCDDCEPFNDYISPLCSISNSAHLPVDHRSYDNSENNSLMKFLLLPMETVNVSVRDLLTVYCT